MVRVRIKLRNRCTKVLSQPKDTEQEALFNAKAGKYGPAGVAPRSYERQFGDTPGTPGGAPDGQMTHVAFDHSDDEEERALRPCPGGGTPHAPTERRAVGRRPVGRRAVGRGEVAY